MKSRRRMRYDSMCRRSGRTGGEEMSITSGPVLCSIDERGVASVTLNRPEVNNAYNGELIEGLLTTLDALEAARGLRVVVITGNGRHFQAGADLKWIDAVRRASP